MPDNNGKNWQFEQDENGIAWVMLDVPGAGTNTLSNEVLQEMDALLDRLATDPPKGVVIGSAKASGFIAGADVKEFTTLKTEEEAYELIQGGHGVMDKIEALSCPTVAMINGFCLGGGLEMTLACNYRVAADEPRTRLGLPEVRLGIHPGFGGSVRSIERLGPFVAMDLMLTGRSVDARRAQRMGLIDYAVPMRQLRNAAAHMIKMSPSVRTPGLIPRMASQRWLRPIVGRIMRKQVAAKAKKAHYPAPYALIELWEKHADERTRMFREEARSVARLITGETAQNLVRAFLLQTRLKGLGEKQRIAPRHVHVIGGGIMGGDIAAWCALQGFRATVQDPRPEALAGALKRAQQLFKRRLKARPLVTAALDRLIADQKGTGLHKADVVIEAIFENLEAKQTLYREIEPKMKPEALLATNTSSIPLEQLSTALNDPGRLVGLHFFNPVAQMQLVEIVRGQQTHEEVVQNALAFTRHIDKLPLPVKSSPGFLVNRILMPYLLEAVILEQEGIPKQVIDKAAKDFGMPMGPLELADTVGLDACLYVGDILSEALGFAVPERLRQLVDGGHLGRKSGRGFYTWKNGKKLKEKRPEFKGEIADVQDRLVLRYINEAVACHREGVVEDADLIDAGMIYATGFAPFRGGPMHYLDAKGRKLLEDRLHDLEEHHGNRFTADSGWAV